MLAALALSPLLFTTLAAAAPIWFRNVQPRQDPGPRPNVLVNASSSASALSTPSGSYFAFGSLPNSFTTNLTGMIVFGDSLSDDGNGTFTLSKGTRPPPQGYPIGTWSNGPTYPSYMASRLGLNLTDKAVGGATTFPTTPAPGITIPGSQEVIPIPSTITQIEGYINTIDRTSTEGILEFRDSLYIILTGGNDFLGGYGISGNQSAQAVQGGVDRLIEGGAKHILLINLFDIPLPGVQNATSTSAASVAQTFTTELAMAYSSIFSASNYTDIVAVSDLFSASKVLAISADQFGFDLATLTEACLTTTMDAQGMANYTVCDRPDTHFFWDQVHPTTRAHSLLASLNIATLLRMGWAQNAI